MRTEMSENHEQQCRCDTSHICHAHVLCKNGWCNGDLMLIRIDYVDGGHHSWPVQSMDRQTDIHLDLQDITACMIVRAVVTANSRTNDSGRISTPLWLRNPKQILVKLGIYKCVAGLTTRKSIWCCNNVGGLGEQHRFNLSPGNMAW